MRDADSATGQPICGRRTSYLAYMATFGFLFAVFMTVFLFGARALVGLHDPALIWIALKLLILTGAVCFAPFAWTSAWLRRPWLFTILAAAIFLIPLLGYVAGVWILAALALAFGLGLRNAFRLLRGFDKRDRIFLLVLPLFAAANLTIWLYLPEPKFTGPYVGPVLKEHALLGILHSDIYFHASIISLIESHAAVSTGLDGLQALPYHVGAHIWFAALMKMIPADAVAMIMVAVPVVVIPAAIAMLVVAIILTLERLSPVAGGLSGYRIIVDHVTRSADRMDRTLY